MNSPGSSSFTLFESRISLFCTPSATHNTTPALVTNEVRKVLDARSVLAHQYRRQEKGRRLYSVLARRKKGKEKISQIE